MLSVVGQGIRCFYRVLVLVRIDLFVLVALMESLHHPDRLGMALFALHVEEGALVNELCEDPALESRARTVKLWAI
jgi:hypothetical protein